MPGTVIPGVVIFPIDPRGVQYGIIRRVTADMFVEYVDRPARGNYLESPDCGRTREVRDAVERIVRRIDTQP